VAAVSAALVTALLGFLDAALACARAPRAPTPGHAHD
jgi:hypothetical protein